MDKTELKQYVYEINRLYDKIVNSYFNYATMDSHDAMKTLNTWFGVLIESDEESYDK